MKALALCFSLLLVSCTASKEAIISRTAIGLEAARAAFTAEDEREQLAIVAAALSKAEGEAKLAEHRKGRDAATKAFQAAWAALAIASLEPSDLNMQRLAQLAAAAIASVKGAP